MAKYLNRNIKNWFGQEDMPYLTKDLPELVISHTWRLLRISTAAFRPDSLFRSQDPDTERQHTAGWQMTSPLGTTSQTVYIHPVGLCCQLQDKNNVPSHRSFGRMAAMPDNADFAPPMKGILVDTSIIVTHSCCSRLDQQKPTKNPSLSFQCYFS